MSGRPTRRASNHTATNAASPQKRTSTVATSAGHGHGLRKSIPHVAPNQSWDEDEEEAEAEEGEELEQDEDAEAREKLEIKREKNRVKQRNLRQRRANHVNELEEANAVLQSDCVSLRHTVRAYQSRQGNLELWVRDLETLLFDQGLGTQVETIRRARALATEPARTKQSTRGRQPRARGHPTISTSSVSSDTLHPMDSFSALVQVAQQQAPASVAMTRSYANSNPEAHHIDPATMYPTPPEIWEHQVPDHRSQYPMAPYPKRVKRESYPREHKDAYHPYAQPRGHITHPPPPFYSESTDYYVSAGSYRPSSVHGYPSRLSPLLPVSEGHAVRPASADASPGGSPRSNLRISALITPHQGSQATTPTENLPTEELSETFVASPKSMSGQKEVKLSPLTPINEVHLPALIISQTVQHTPLHTPVTPSMVLPPLHNVLSSSMTRKDYTKLDIEVYRRFSASPLPPSHRDEHKHRSHSR